MTGNTAQQFLRPCQPLMAWLASVGSSLSVKAGAHGQHWVEPVKDRGAGTLETSQQAPPPSLRQVPNLTGNLPPCLRAHHNRDQIPASQSAPTVRAVSAIVPSLWSVSISCLGSNLGSGKSVSSVVGSLAHRAPYPIPGQEAQPQDRICSCQICLPDSDRVTVALQTSSGERRRLRQVLQSEEPPVRTAQTPNHRSGLLMSSRWGSERGILATRWDSERVSRGAALLQRQSVP